MSDEEFEMLMQDKEKEADKLLSGWSKLDKEERQTYIKRMNLDTELVSIINGKMVYNNLKKQSFIYKQALRKTYKDGISIRDSFMQSEKFELTNQNLSLIHIFDFEIDFLKRLPHYKVQWNGVTKITPIRYKVTQLTKVCVLYASLATIISPLLVKRLHP